MTRTRIFSVTLLAAVFAFGSAAFAQVPTKVPFQGLLLDSGGAPITNVVNLDFALYDALLAGTQLWSESHTNVPVVDGVYSVELGGTVPLTSTELGGGTAFLEITVDGETMTPRQQLLSVPYAIVSDQLGGLPAIFYEQIVEHGDFDGADPPNLDPSEGFADVDGDGRANFIDSDNDGDGLFDSFELSQGSNINLVTPSMSGFTPPGPYPTFAQSTIHLDGTFLSGVTSVQIGVDVVAPYNVTATGLDFDYTPAAAATLPVVVTASNGESDAGESLTFDDILPTIVRTEPTLLRESAPTTVTIVGTDFIPTTTVEVGGVPVTTTFVSATELTADVPAQSLGSASLHVTHPSGSSVPASNATVPVVSAAWKAIFPTDASYQGGFGGVAAADALCQAEATTYSLSGTYKAWLSDSLSTPASSFAQSAAPYMNLFGAQVAADWTELTTTGIAAPVSLTPASNVAIIVWTGTEGDGTAASDTCSDWSTASSATNGRRGSTNGLIGDQWTSLGLSSCNNVFRVLCVEQ